MFWSFLTAIVLLIFTVFGFACGFMFCQYFRIEKRPTIYHSHYDTYAKFNKKEDKVDAASKQE